MKSEKVRIYFLSDVFRYVVIQKFYYHGNVTYGLLLSIYHAFPFCFSGRTSSDS